MQARALALAVSFRDPDAYTWIVRAIAIGLMALLAAPVAASARGQSQFPVGNSAANQYQEVVPTAGGGQPSISIAHSGGGSGQGGSGPIATTPARALAAFTRATAPKRVRGSARSGSPGASPASELARSVTGTATSSGLGALLPAILAGTVLAALAWLLWRRSRRAT